MLPSVLTKHCSASAVHTGKLCWPQYACNHLVSLRSADDSILLINSAFHTTRRVRNIYSLVPNCGNHGKFIFISMCFNFNGIDDYQKYQWKFETSACTSSIRLINYWDVLVSEAFFWIVDWTFHHRHPFWQITNFIWEKVIQIFVSSIQGLVSTTNCKLYVQ